MKWEHSAGVIPFIQQKGERKYLLLLSALTKNKLWEFPKGAIEEGEDAVTAALREFQEETGIKRVEIVPGFKKPLKYFYKREGELIGKTVTYFLGRVRNNSKVELSGESKDYCWVTFEEAPQKVKHKNIREVLAGAEEFLETGK
jgi:8-oxo-dGTP pyrophosphatase MutT (NUDIX family)